ncbi:MAG: biotin synthase BioB [Candidatus Omnitrophota bacterium]
MGIASKEILKKALRGRSLSRNEARKIYLDPAIELFDLLCTANSVRKSCTDGHIELCSIVNAKSGNCSEDCRFCAQSARHRAAVDTYPLLKTPAIVAAALSARKNGATCFGIVTSGEKIRSAEEMSAIRDAITTIKKKAPGLRCSVSIGSVTGSYLKELRRAGLDRFHHNLETSERFFPRMCTTHTYRDRLKTLTAAKRAGVKICCGGIFGIGEDRDDRIDLAFALKKLKADSVPLNFLHPVPGTPLGSAAPLPVVEILRTIALFRIVLPTAEIKVCGGREVNLGAAQRLIFFAGASGMMIGNYLTQPGNDPADDLKMLRELGLKVK